MILRILLTAMACSSLFFSSAQNGEPVLEVVGRKMNLHVIDEAKGAKSKYSFSFVQDTMFTIKMPKNMWKIDTLVEMDLVTQEEGTTYATDSMLRVHINLGTITKQEISAAVGDGFSVSKNCQCNMVSADLIIIKDKGTVLHIDYSKPDQVQKAQQEINNLPKNAQVIVKNVLFKCPDNENGFDELTFTDMAVVRVKE